MKRILKNADFSANNLGQVDLPVQLDEYAAALFTNSFVEKTLTNRQKKSVETYFNALQSNGLFSKVAVMYLPFLAGNVSEAFINLKESYFSKTKVMLNTANQLTATVLNSGGLLIGDKATTNSGLGVSLLSKLTAAGCTADNITVLADLSPYDATNATQQTLSVAVNNTSYKMAVSVGNNLSFSNAFASGDYILVPYSIDKLCGFSVKSGTRYHVSSSGITSGSNFTTSSFTEFIFGSNTFGTSRFFDYGGLQSYIVSTGLDATELATMRTLYSDLISNF